MNSAQRIAAILCSIIALVWLPGPARADVVTDWNVITLQLGGPLIQRTLTLVHIAMFDAVNSIQRRYRPYHSRVDAPPGASAEAAAAAAAHGILVRRFPAQQSALDAALAVSVAGIPNGAAKTNGLALGDLVAAEIHTLRSRDNMLEAAPPYAPSAGPGAYQLTPPEFAAPVNAGASTWLPFVLTSAAQFRPNGPLSLPDRRYVRDLEEVLRLGAAGSADRTADQTLSARWYIELVTPAMNRIARTEASAAGLDLMTDARLFALLNIAMSDAVTSVFEAKYVFNSWRPVTAIRDAATDGHPATSADLNWMPLLVTPPHPEYPSAHSVIQWAGVQVLESMLGQHHAFSTTSSSVPGVTRTFRSFRDYATDGSLSRIYGGIHFRTAVEEGARQGKKIGTWILERALLPMPLGAAR